MGFIFWYFKNWFAVIRTIIIGCALIIGFMLYCLFCGLIGKDIRKVNGPVKTNNS